MLYMNGTTKEKLLQIAFREFLMHTYKDVTLSHMVKELGLTKGAFYHYFASKQDLFEQVVEMYISSLTDLFGVEYNGKHSLTGNIMTLVKLGITQLNEMRAELEDGAAPLNLYGFMTDALKYYPGFNKLLKKHQQEAEKNYCKYISIAKDRGEIKMSIDGVLLAGLMHALIDGITMNEFIKPEKSDAASRIERSLEFIYELIKK
jgi:TetR/AcrR family transcriptional regulator, transcriptional repressor for nem operon